MTKSILCNYGYIIDKKSISDKLLEEIKNDLTVEPLIIFKMPKFNKKDLKFTVYQEGISKILIPKFYGIEKIGLPEKEEYNDISQTLNINFNGSLHNYQNNIINKIIKNYINENGSLKKFGGGILSVPPGKGKTVMALYLVSLLRIKTLIIVHKTFLVNQWVERIKQYLPNASVGYLYQDIIDIENKDIVIGMLQSISMKNYEDEIFEEFNLVIFDEVHHLGAKVFSRALLKIQSNFTLGLSATPERKDKLEKIFYWYLGPIIYHDYDENIKNVKVEIYKFNLSKPNDLFKIKINKITKTINYTKMLTNITKINERNQLIIKMIKIIFNENNRKLLILSNFIEHLKLLADIIKTELPNLSFGFYIGGMKINKLKESEDKQIILASYAMASEGLDIKELNSLIFATPKSDVIQSTGRILRKNHSITPIIYDIVDNISVFNAQSKKRIKQYIDKNYEISYYNTKDDNIIHNIKNPETDDDLFI